MLRQLGAYWVCDIKANGAVWVTLAVSDEEALRHIQHFVNSHSIWCDLQDHRMDRGPIDLDRLGLKECAEHGCQCPILPDTGQLLSYASMSNVHREVLQCWCPVGDHLFGIGGYRDPPSDSAILASLVGFKPL